jgi:capsular polysaccharide transport system permease protein
VKDLTVRKKNKYLKNSYFFLVLFPSIFIIIYLLFIASDRYASGSGFAVRSMSSQGSNDLLSSMTGLVGSGSSTSDSYIVVKFLESRDLLQSLILNSDFNEIYGSQEIDFISRISDNLKIEERLKAWKHYINASFDPSSGIIRFEVQAFKPEDAHLMASLILAEVKSLTNRLSEQARQDAMYYAEKELALAEKRLIDARKRLKLFRKNTSSVDLSASAMAQIELLTNLEKELIQIKARIEVLKNSLNDDAPSIMALKRKSEALEFQISQKSGGLRITGQNDELSSLLADQEELETEKTFAETSYASALASMEIARMEASRNQRYLAIYSRPSLPEYSIYPKRITYSLFIFIAFNVFWGIGILIIYSFLDQLRSGWVDDESISKVNYFNNKFNKVRQNIKRIFSHPNFSFLRNFNKK